MLKVGFLVASVAASASMFIAAPAVAQSQTIEGAHEFLRITFASGGVNGAFNGGSGYNVVQQTWFHCQRKMVFAGSNLMPAQYDDVCGNTQYGTWTAPDYRSIAYKPVSRCTGNFAAGAPSYEMFYRQGNTHYNRNYLNALNRNMDWSKVSEVSKNGTVITVREGGVSYRFEIASADLVARTVFAMEFIKSNCDAAASTGF